MLNLNACFVGVSAKKEVHTVTPSGFHDIFAAIAGYQLPVLCRNAFHLLNPESTPFYHLWKSIREKYIIAIIAILLLCFLLYL